MLPRLFVVALMLLVSGGCALVYQTAWLREMRLVFGMSTAASAAVLAIFMGGLGLGGVLLGRRADRHPSPLALYGRLELLVSLAAAVTPLLIALVRHAYIAAGGTPAMGLGLGTFLRLVLATLVLGVPTVLMGGTLPAAARAVESDEDPGRRRLALLYGTNTLGALAGTALSTFLLLEVLGIRTMLWSATVVNALLGLIALVLARRWNKAAAASDAPRAAPSEAAAPGASSAESAPPLMTAPAAPRPFVLGAAFLVGFAFLLMELVWYRMLAPILGGSSYTFGLILAMALLGIGLGGVAVSRAREGRPATLGAFALTCSLEALFLAIPLALGDRLASVALLLRSLSAMGMGGQVLAWGAVAGVVVLPAAFVSGVQFPLLVGLLGRGRKDVGGDTGAAYAWNTAGSILGSLAGGFGLLPLLTAPGAWKLATVCLALLGVASALLGLRRQARAARTPWLLAAPVAAILAVALLGATGPTAAWRHSGIGAGRTSLPSLTVNGIRDWMNLKRRSIAWEADGVESSVALSTSNGYAFLVAGKSDGSARGDAPTQVMGGVLGALLHPDPRSAFVVGLGTGSTAGWLAAIPAIERVDVAELEPAILDVARACTPVNEGVLDNPKVSLFLGDAREQLLTSELQYDIIFSEPSNPYRAGISSLFTVEFYEAARDRLSGKGLFVQWLQAYEVDAATVRTVFATLGVVFGSVETWYSKGGDMLLVASREPPVHDAARLAARVAQEPYKSAMFNVWRAVGLEGLLAHFLARDEVTRLLAAAEGDRLSTDDRNRVEFGFARSVGQAQGFEPAELRAFARARGWDRPVLAGHVVPDWTRVQDARLESAVAEGNSVDGDSVDGDLRKRAEALAAFAAGELPAALLAWRAQGASPDSPLQLALVSESLAEAKDTAAEPLAERLRAFQPIEADLVLARLRLREGRPDEAASLLESVFDGLRRDPWPLPAMTARGLRLAREVGAGNPVLAGRMLAALEKPFVLQLLEEERNLARLDLALRAEIQGVDCHRVFDPFEPSVPWQLPFLMARAKCRAATQDPAVTAAVADLEEFLEGEPTRFAAGL